MVRDIVESTLVSSAMHLRLVLMCDHVEQVVIITGSNTGVGYETTKALVAMGAHVIMGKEHSVGATSRERNSSVVFRGRSWCE